MKICFFAASNSIHSFKWIKFFAERGHEILWISLCTNDFDPLPNVTFKEFKLKNPFYIFSLLSQIKTEINKFNPQVLHIHSAGTYGLLGTLAFSGTKIITAWGSDILFAGKHWLKGPFVKYALSKAKWITTDANHMIEAMKELGVPQNKIIRINFGIDTKKFHFYPEAKDSTGKIHIASMRNFEEVYNIESFIESLPMLSKNYPLAHFYIVGRGTLKEKLEKMVTDLNLQERCDFVGFIKNDELPKFLSKMDVFVSTSLSDAGISASIAEAMSCEVPVVVTNTGENDYWISDSQNGFLISPKNPFELGQKIAKLIDNKELRKTLGQKGREKIVSENDYFNEMSKMESFYLKEL